MTEELYEYLVRHQWTEDIANDICDAYLKGGDTLIQYAKSLNDDEHDYTDEIIQMIKDWKKEVGE